MATNAQLAQDQYELYQYCRVEGGHENFLREMEVAKRYFASKQWTDADYKKRTGEGRLSFTVNEIFRTINSLLGELGQLASDVRFDPTNGDDATARVLNKLNEHVDRANKMFMHDERVLLDGMLGGRGFYKFRITFDENMQGNIWLGRQRPENTILDYNVHSPDPETWDRIFTTEVVSADDIEAMYGVDIAKHVNEAPYADWLDLEDRTLAQSLGLSTAFFGDLEGTQFRRHRLISQQFRDYKYKDCFVDKATGDTSEIPENWPREKVREAQTRFNLGIIRRKVKTLRWRVTCNNVVLHDEDSPYKFFDVVPFFPWFLDGTPLSLFSVLKGPQDLLNYTVSEETHILGTTAHSGWKIKQGSLKNMTMRDLENKGSKNGLVLELDDPSDAERITPGQPATGFQNFGDRARSWINDLANVSPSMLGTQSEYAPGKQVSAQLSRAPVNLHAPLVMFQYAKQLLAERKLDLFQTFYTETRVMKIASSAYGQTEEIAINQPDGAGNILYDLTVGKYTARLMPVGSKLQAEEFAFDQLAYMKEMGINVPNSLFVTSSALNAKSDVIEQLLAANKGELSPEEQRAKELELQQAELDVEDTRAAIEGKRAAAELARGRAKRAEMDASFDPRTARASLDERRLLSEHSRGMRQLDLQAEQGTRDTAVKLTKIAADAAKPAPAAKPGAKKAAKKTAKKAAKKTTPKKQPR
jgi:hypothetical protein